MIPYFGGKSYLADWVISHFPNEYQTMSYCEVFGGGGWVLYKKEPSRIETYNDLNKNIVNLFRVIRDRFPEFNHRANWSLHSRELFHEARTKLQDDKTIGDVERAIQYAILQTQSFSGDGHSWTYRVSPSHVFSGKWLPLLKRLELINIRLKRVQIECLDFETVIKKYDSKDTLFYLDPPYFGKEKYYQKAHVNFTHEDHTRLANTLHNIKGKFILSYYDHPQIKKLYPENRVVRKCIPKYGAKSKMTETGSTKPRANEILIMNY